jgi:hypothetical protein
MHTAWLRSKGGLDACPMCIDEHGNPENPNFSPVDLLSVTEDTTYPIPCKIHGDPRICMMGNTGAFELYSLLNQNCNYNYRQETQGQKTVWKCYLDLNICQTLCNAWGLPAQETLKKLNIIHKEIFS